MNTSATATKPPDPPPALASEAARLSRLHPRAREALQALQALLACVDERFTGAFRIDMKDGLPQLVRTTRTRRLGRGDR